MSRIGRLPVAIPAGVTVEVAENNVVTVKGPKGTLTKELPTEMEIKVEGEEVTVSFLVNSPFPRILTPSLGFFTIPLSISVSTDTVAPSSNLSSAPRLIATIVLEFLFVNPLFGILLYKGI